MRCVIMGVVGLVLTLQQAGVAADDETTREVLGVLSGMLGGQPPATRSEAVAEERERLVSLLQSGEFATTRQGEPIDLTVLGVPLTRSVSVYTASPLLSPSSIRSGWTRCPTGGETYPGTYRYCPYHGVALRPQ